jgi:hypothetical protein
VAHIPSSQRQGSLPRVQGAHLATQHQPVISRAPLLRPLTLLSRLAAHTHSTRPPCLPSRFSRLSTSPTTLTKKPRTCPPTRDARAAGLVPALPRLLATAARRTLALLTTHAAPLLLPFPHSLVPYSSLCRCRLYFYAVAQSLQLASCAAAAASSSSSTRLVLVCRAPRLACGWRAGVSRVGRASGVRCVSCPPSHRRRRPVSAPHPPPHAINSRSITQTDTVRRVKYDSTTSTQPSDGYEHGVERES